MSEHELQQRLLLALGRGDTRLFRNNVGTGWVGQTQVIRQRTSLLLNPGDAVIRHARPLHAGLCPGSADLVGWKTITITPEMVGQQVAVFTSIEVKAPRGRVSPEQLAWDATVRRAGGLSGIARSEDEARGILDLNQRA
jgi:hypothetical protein